MNLQVLLILNIFMLFFQLCECFIQGVYLGLVVFLLSFEVTELGDELFEAGLVLASHIGYDVSLPVLLLFE